MRTIKFQVILDGEIVGYERLGESGWKWMWIDLNPDKGERWISGVLPTDAKAERSISNVTRRMFTGILDKNGKEVYEGDIDKHCGTVMFGEWEYAFDSECPSEKHTGFYFSSGVPFPQKDMEIIGNIFEKAVLNHL